MKGYIAGGIFTLIGIYLAVSLKEPHFYTFFSVGLFLIFLEVYKTIVHERLFAKWKPGSHVLFWFMLLLVSVGIDIIGLKLGYWNYPFYSTPFDEVVKYIFEWGIALMYVTLAFFIGLAIFEKHHIRRAYAIILSLICFVIPIGLITEYFNHMAVSWVVLKTPITSFSVGGYFIVFQTLGYWVMALIPWVIYLGVQKLRKWHRSRV